MANEEERQLDNHEKGPEENSSQQSIQEINDEYDQSDEDLSDLLQELRILLQGSQVLTAFLIILPFNQLFDKLNDFEKYIYLATFLCAITCLVLFTAPATHHRLVRPLINRVDFKHLATRLMIIGLIPLSLALVFVVQLVVSQVVSFEASFVIAGIFALGLLITWWIYPLLNRNRY
ncbi:MAG: hypothetical protein J0I20_13150 [Chloroflexi bacterium]|nr:hypothetical protein [Chloroflexota bacterium]